MYYDKYFIISKVYCQSLRNQARVHFADHQYPLKQNALRWQIDGLESLANGYRTYQFTHRIFFHQCQQSRVLLSRQTAAPFQVTQKLL